MERHFHFMLFPSFSDTGLNLEISFTQMLNVHSLIEAHFNQFIWELRRKATSPRIIMSLGIKNQITQISR